MVHIFKALGLDLALDVDGGALHVLDDICAQVLSNWHQPRQEWFDILTKAYGQRAVEETIIDIETLIEQGQLFTKAHDEMPKFQGVIKALCLNIAHDCDLRCGYCFAATGDFGAGRALMPAQVGMAAMDFLFKHSENRKHVEVDFFGGEPTMNMSAVRAISAYGLGLAQKQNKTLHLTMTTNAYHLEDKTLSFINENMENVVLSLDGRKSVHDRMRKDAAALGSYDKVLTNIRRIVEGRGGLDWFVRGTFTHHNLDFAQDVMHLHDLGFKRLSVEPVVAEENKNYAIRKEDLPKIYQEYEALAEYCLDMRRQDNDFVFFHFQVDLTGGPCVAKRLLGCGAGNEYVAVTPEGDIYPCHQFVGRQGYCMGNVLTGDFDLQMQQRFASCNLLTKPACVKCWAKYHCAGGCAANSLTFTGNLFEPYEIGCLMEKKRLELALALYAWQQMDEDTGE